MDNFQKKSVLLIALSISILVVAGLIIYFLVNPLPPKQQAADSPADELAELSSRIKNTSEQNSETETRQPHTIVIENVQNTQQLSEILNIIETYSRENDVSNLKIECVKKEDMDSSLAPASLDE